MDKKFIRIVSIEKAGLWIAIPLDYPAHKAFFVKNENISPEIINLVYSGFRMFVDLVGDKENFSLNMIENWDACNTVSSTLRQDLETYYKMTPQLIHVYEKKDGLITFSIRGWCPLSPKITLNLIELFSPDEANNIQPNQDYCAFFNSPAIPQELMFSKWQKANLIQIANKSTKDIIYKTNPSTGYIDRVTCSNDDIVLFQTEYIKSDSEPIACGAPVNKKMTLTAKDRGSAIIKIEYYRPWIPNKSSDGETYLIEVY